MKPSPVPECGFRIAPFLGSEEILALTALHDEVNREQEAEHSNTMVGATAGMKRHVFDGIRAVVEEKLNRLVPGHRMSTAFFVTKKAGSSSEQGRLALHPDPTTVNLDEAIGINVWVPLCDVDGSNGCMNVVPYSPKLGYIRALPPWNPSPYDAIQHEIEAHFMTQLQQKAGTACIFDTRLLHATDANRSSRQRIAILISLIPEGAARCIYFWNPLDPKHLELYEVNQEFLYDLNPIQYPSEEVRNRARFIASIDYAPEQLSLAAFERIVARPASSLPDREIAEPVTIKPAQAEASIASLAQPSLWTRLTQLFSSGPSH